MLLISAYVVQQRFEPFLVSSTLSEGLALSAGDLTLRLREARTTRNSETPAIATATTRSTVTTSRKQSRVTAPEKVCECATVQVSERPGLCATVQVSERPGLCATVQVSERPGL